MSNDDGGSIRTRAVRSVKWSVLAEVTSRVSSPIIFLVLARLLAPSDFGMMTAALGIVTFAQIFWDAGLGRALVQIQDKLEDATHVVFWSNLGLALLAYA